VAWRSWTGLGAGKNSLYHSLQTVLGDEVESALGQQKRKRQAHKDKTMELLSTLCAILLSAMVVGLWGCEPAKRLFVASNFLFFNDDDDVQRECQTQID